MANGGIIGPVVTPPNVQTQSAPGVWTLQEAQEYIRQGLWPRRYDPLYNYTTLLLSGNGANNATNNSFLDSSSNNFTVTRNGNTTQGTFSPFSQTGWGNYFDGTGDYLSVADNSVLRLGTSNFTIECWVNRAANGTAHSILAKGGASTGWLLEVTSGNLLQFTHTTTTITTSLPVYAGNWVHVAAVREGTGANQFKLYINGTLAQTATMSTDFTQTDTLYIGANRSAATTMNGYISNVRIVNGTALYTAQFTPSTTPLTTTSQGATAAQVELLTCQSNRFLDNSGNGFTVTPAGNSAVVAFSPFNATRPWDPLTYGGGGYFDGSGDYLGGIGSASNWAFMSNTTALWSLECWLFNSSSTAQQIIDTNGGSSANVGLYVNKTASNTILVDITRGVSGTRVITGTTTGTLTQNAWNHLLITYDQSLSTQNLKVYINGATAETFNKTANAPSGSNPTYSLLVGGVNASAAEYYNGYISNLRISNVIRSSGVPTTPYTSDANTSLLLNFTNIGITDATSKNTLETVGDAKISTAQSKFGGSSMYFDGTGDYLSIPSNELLAFGTGDFTIEMWVYWNNVSFTQTLFDFRPNATGSSISPYIELTSSGTLIYYVGGATRITTSAVTATSWTHVALSRSGTSTKIFINGTQSGSTYTDSNSYVQSGATIGLNRNNGGVSFQYMNGYIQDLRITKGVARYTENFAVPDSAFATLGNTPPSVDPYFDYTTLLLPGSGSNNATNSSFLDSSANNFTITRNGNTTQGTFSPFSQTGWGNYFDGSGDYLTATNNSAYDFGSGNFTIEAFAYPTTASQLAFCARGETTGFSGFILSTTNFLATTNGSSWDISISFTTALTANAWNHVALVRNGNVYTAYLNGVANGITTVSGTIVAGTAALTIGRRSGQTDYSGYLSNFRIVKGTAVYTAAFSPPTSPLTPISGTSLLTCQSNRFIDNSSNNFTITVNGNTSVVAFSPFNPTASWSAATYGGSGYFDGSDDFLDVGTNYPSSLDLGSNNFTIEAFVYLLAATKQLLFGNLNDSTGTRTFFIMLNNTTAPARYEIGLGSSSYNLGSGTITTNQWVHVCLMRSGTSIYLFENGVQIGTTQTFSGSVTSVANQLRVGGASTGQYDLSGYVSNLRMVIGSAVYSTSGFTPPTAPLTAITNTSLLLNFTNVGVYDATSKNDLETVGDAKISTAQSVWTAYGSSMYFDGNGDQLLPPASVYYVLGTGDFTVELWAYSLDTGSSLRGIVDFRTAASGTNGILLRENSGGFLVATGSTTSLSTTTGRTANAWQHIALVRSSGTLSLYLGGSLQTSTAYSTNLTDNALRISGFVDTNASPYAYYGYMQDLRISKYARYTSAFQPPSAPLALR